MSGNRWQRLGGLAGIVFVALFIANLFTPSTPDADDPSSGLAREIADDRTGHVFSVYLDGLSLVAFLIFLAALWSLLRRAEPEPGASLVALLGGLALSTIVLVSGGVYLALVEAADERREPAAIRALLELDSIIFIPAGFAIVALYAGIALSAIPTRSLPSWLGWSAAAFAVLFAVTLLGIFSRDDEGGPLGIAFFLGLLAQFLWILAAGVVMIRRTGPRPGGTQRAVPA
jgi:cytochrome bd-type quinol oxidase subunit 2